MLLLIRIQSSYLIYLLLIRKQSSYLIYLPIFLQIHSLSLASFGLLSCNITKSMNKSRNSFVAWYQSRQTSKNFLNSFIFLFVFSRFFFARESFVDLSTFSSKCIMTRSVHTYASTNTIGTNSIFTNSDKETITASPSYLHLWEVGKTYSKQLAGQAGTWFHWLVYHDSRFSGLSTIIFL